MHTLRKLFLLGLMCLFTVRNGRRRPGPAARRCGRPRSGATLRKSKLPRPTDHMWGGNIEFRERQVAHGHRAGLGFRPRLRHPPLPGHRVQLHPPGRAVRLGSPRRRQIQADRHVDQLLAARHACATSPSRASGRSSSRRLGLTYYSPSGSTINIDGTDYAIESSTKFSFNFGLGFKKYFGQNEKIGLRASFKVMPTLYDSGAGLWFGTGGASLGITGYAIWQFEAAAGLTVKFGS